jgi:phenylpropionate dioxygenase-like ring-hydroxylating dioxygenase large terminal subunit
MASAIESDELTRVGPGTLMGDLMRQYWIPAAKSSELKPGGEPIKLMLLGEKLIAFRDETSGKVGVMDHRCPHRCASLFLGRNEPGGLRCIYHGWKFDTEGNCLEMPNVAPAQRFEDKVKAKAYKVNERGGLIWVYMGARAEAPPMPMIEATRLPEEELNIQFVLRECNWMQALEGDIDTSHFSFLHIGSVTADQVSEDSTLKYQVACRSPEYHVADTEWGTMYAAYRPTEDDKKIYWRFAQFGFPFWAQVPQGNFIDRVSARAWVPMDDHHTMSVTLNWTKMSRASSQLKEGKPIPGAQAAVDLLPNENHWYGRFRAKANDGNNYFIDREAQRNGTIYSGITNIHIQDQAVTESMGPITDHDFEHLAPSDQMIARTRRRLVHAARALREKGTVPPAVDDPEVFLRARSGEAVVATTDWREAYAQKLQEVIRPVYAVAAE